VVNRVELDPETQIRLVRAHCLRMVPNKKRSIQDQDQEKDDEEWDNGMKIYYSVDNTR